jgi:hypothetical protein
MELVEGIGGSHGGDRVGRRDPPNPHMSCLPREFYSIDAKRSLMVDNTSKENISVPSDKYGISGPSKISRSNLNKFKLIFVKWCRIH